MARLVDIGYAKDLVEQEQEKQLRVAEYRRDRRCQSRKDTAQSVCIALTAAIWFLLCVYMLEDMKGASEIADVAKSVWLVVLGPLITLMLYVEWTRDWRQNIAMVVKSYVLPVGFAIGIIYILSRWIN
jgi:hypothetical protein